jgi:hypothetical protein
MARLADRAMPPDGRGPAATGRGDAPHCGGREAASRAAGGQPASGPGEPEVVTARKSPGVQRRPRAADKTAAGVQAGAEDQASADAEPGAAPRTSAGEMAGAGGRASQAGKAGQAGRKSNAGGPGRSGVKNVPGGEQAPAPGAEPDSDRERPRMPPVRLAPRDELAAAARVAPLLRAGVDLSRWAAKHYPADPGQPGDPAGRATGAGLPADAADAAAADLELTPNEVDAAWRVVLATGLLEAGRPEIGNWDDSEVLGAWDSALAAILDAEDLDGLATALYTVGTPVRIDSLFEAYTAAAGAPRPERGSPAQGGSSRQPGEDEAAALSRALETLADLGVVELGTEETAGGLTVTLSPLGVWGVHRRLRGQGWHVPVLGSADRDGAVGLLMTLASCDAEDGETEIGTWLADRTPVQAARELIQAAAGGSPGLRGAAFAVLDRIGSVAIPEIRAALGDPLLRAHAAVWLHEHDEEAELRPADRTWLLVDLGAGLLEEADPRDVVAELLPEVPALAQAEIVAGLWQVDHPGVVDLLTALSQHHPNPSVARAARKAAFKARSA